MNSIIKPYSVLLFIIGICIVNSSQALTLEESVEQVMLNDPMLKQSYSRMKSTDSEKDIAGSEYLPEVILSAAAGEEDTKYKSGVNIDNQLTRTELGILVRQSIFSGLSTKYEVRRLAHETESERLKLYADAEDKAMEVIEVYLQLIEAQQLLQLSLQNEQDHKKILEDVKTKVDNQLAARSDLAQVESRLSNAQASTIAARNRLFSLEARYFKLVNQAPQNLTEPVANNANIPQTINEAMELAKSNHQAIQSAMLDIEATESAYKAAAADYYPSLDLELAANADENIDGIEGKNQDASIMLRLQYSLYQGGKTNAQRRASAWRYQEAIELRSETEREVLQAVKQSWYDNELLESQLDFLKLNVENSKVAEEAYREQFNVGKRELLDVLISKTELFRARQSYIETWYDKLMANYQLKNSTGVLLQSLFIEYPVEWTDEES